MVKKAKQVRRARSAAGRVESPAEASADVAQDRLTNDIREPGTRIGFLIHDVSRLRRTLYDHKVKPLGLTRSQWWLLAQLTRRMNPDGMLQTELARMLDVGKVAVGGLVDRLEASGFVVRKPDQADRRAKRIVITEAGRAVLKDMVRISSELNETIFAGSTKAEMKAAEKFMDRLKANLRSQLEARLSEQPPT